MKMRFWQKIYVLTLVLFLVCLNVGIFSLAAITHRKNVDSMETTAKGEYNYIAMTFERDYNDGGGTNVSLLMKTYVNHYKNKGVMFALLKNGETILIYPEQAMWWNYRKPRPFKIGGFKMAYRANVPVVPAFITMKDDKRLDEKGYPIQRLTVHIMPAIYPDKALGEKAGAEKMKEIAYAQYLAKYEEVYGEEVIYDGKIREV